MWTISDNTLVSILFLSNSSYRQRKHFVWKLPQEWTRILRAWFFSFWRCYTKIHVTQITRTSARFVPGCTKGPSRGSCPRATSPQVLYPTPRLNRYSWLSTSGIFKEIEGVSNVKDCVVRCCRHEQCNVAFMTDDKCYQVTCTTDELCKPVLSPNSDSKEHVFMVLVKPTGEDSWQDVLSQGW